MRGPARRAPTTSTCRSRSTARRAEVNDAIRGAGSYDTAITRDGATWPRPASRASRCRSSSRARTSRSSTSSRRSPTAFGAQLRLTRLRPSGRGADVWDRAASDRRAAARAVRVAARARRGRADRRLVLPPRRLRRRRCPGSNLCGAGRVVCLIDPIGDVYACPFVIHDEFLAGNVRDPGGFARVWRESELFADLREPQSAGACASCGLFDTCRGGCMAAKFFTGLPLAGPDPECVLGHGERLLAARGDAPVPKPTRGHVEASARRAQGRATRARSRSCRSPMKLNRNPWFESVAEAQRRAKRRLPKSVYSALIAGSEAGVTLADNIAAFGELGFAPHVGGAPAAARPDHDRDGPGDLAAGADLADRRAGGPSRRRGRGRARRGRARHRDGAELVRAASRSRRSSRPTRRRSSRSTGRARASRSPARIERARAAGAAGLIVTLDWSFSHSRDWGSPWIPDKIDLKAMLRLAPEVLTRPAWLAEWAQRRRPARPDRAQHGAARRAGADVLRRLRRVDADPAADLGGPALAARAVGRAVHAQGRDPRRRRPARGRRRRHRDLGLQPRRQQPRRHAGVDPRAARDRRGRRRPDRGPARRRHPARQRRRQGAALWARGR